MPTYTFSRTLAQMRALVLRKLRYLDPNETPDGNESAIVDEAINLRLKELHALGVLWFNVAPAATDLALLAGTASKSLSAVTDFLYAVTMHVRVGTEDKPVSIISHTEYQAIPSKADRGEPEVVFISGGTAYFHPTPDSAYIAKMTYQAIAEDTSSPSAPDVPVAMLRALVTLVASDCADDFSVPEPRLLRLRAEAEKAERTLRTLNNERVDNTTVAPDYF